jgi:hypothetical protein
VYTSHAIPNAVIVLRVVNCWSPQARRHSSVGASDASVTPETLAMHQQRAAQLATDHAHTAITAHNTNNTSSNPMIQQHQHHAAAAVVSSNRGKVTHHMPHTFATAASTPINSSSAMATTLACTPTSSSGVGAGASATSADALLRGVGNEDDVLFRWLSKVCYSV